MTSRQRIRTLTALGFCAPLVAAAAFGGATLASADSAPQQAVSAQQGAVSEVQLDARSGEPTDLLTTGSKDFAEPTDPTVSSKGVAKELYAAAANPDLSDSATCASGLDMDDPQSVTTCTVVGVSGEEETYYAYISPSSTAESDYWLYFAQDAPLSDAAATALNDGLNGTGVYPAFGEQDDVQQVLDPELAAERANFVLDGVGRDDMTVTDVDGDVDLAIPEPVRGTAVEDGSGREVGVTLLPIPTTGETPGLLVSIDGP